MKHLRSKAVALVMTLAMVLSLTSVAFAASFTDMPADDYWSYAALNAAVENKLLSGKTEEMLDPSGNLSRAEMAAIVGRAFGAVNEASLAGFIDVSASEWFYADVAKAYQMGVMNGDGNTMKPYDDITREEAFTILARALKLADGSAADLAACTDASSVSFWAVAPVAAMVKAGYVKGDETGALNPGATITREEFAQVMYNIFSNYLTAEGTYSEVGEGSVMINADGVTLKDVTVHGDVVIGDGVGDGDVTLDNVTVEGRVVVRGGGVNSVHILRSHVTTVIVSKVEGNVRVVGDKSSTVSTVAVTAGAETVVIENIIVTVVDVVSTTPVEVKNSTVTTVSVDVAGANVALTSGTTVTTVDVASAATNTTVTTEAGVTVTTVKSDVDVTVTGDGKVQNTTGEGAVTDGQGNEVGTSTPSTGGGSFGGGSTGGNHGDGTGGTISGEHGGDAIDDDRGNATGSNGTVTTPTVPDEPQDTSGLTASEGKELCGNGEAGAAAAHDWEKATVKAVSCTEDGSYAYTCKNCGATKTETVAKPAGGHSYTKKVVKSQPTCSEFGAYEVFCANCNAQTDDEQIAKLAHDFENSNRGGFDENGHWTTCAYCDEKDTDEHNLAYTTAEATAATLHTAACDGCGYTMTSRHTFGEWTTKSEATCQAKKVEHQTCEDCEYEATREVGNLADHTFDPKKATGKCEVCGEADCPHTGVGAGEKCEVCGVTKPAAHQHGSWTYAPAADANGKKMHTKTCGAAGCTATPFSETVECAGGEPDVDETPGDDCQTPGTTVTTVSCTLCEQTISTTEEEGPVGDHQWGNVDGDDENGYTKSCTVKDCGETIECDKDGNVITAP